MKNTVRFRITAFMLVAVFTFGFIPALGVKAQVSETRPPLKIYVDGKLTEFDPPPKIESGNGGYGVIYVPAGSFYKAVGRENAETKGRKDYVILYDTVKQLDGVDMLWYWDENIVRITTARATEPANVSTPVSASPASIIVPESSSSASPKPVPVSTSASASAPVSVSAATATTPTVAVTPAVAATSTVIAYSTENPPFIGATLGDILINPNDPDTRSGNKFREAYSYGTTGQCGWYALGRFTEVHGIGVNIRPLGNPKDWLNTAKEYEDLLAIADPAAVQSLTIAVFKPSQGPASPGHAVFVEFVERGKDGNPAYVYFTETNGANTLNKGVFDHGYDGIVQKLSFKNFKNKAGGLIGCIAAK